MSFKWEVWKRDGPYEIKQDINQNILNTTTRVAHKHWCLTPETRGVRQIMCLR